MMRLAPLLLAAGLCLHSPQAFADCMAYRQAQTAASAADADAAVAAAAAAQTEQECSQTERTLANRMAGLARYNAIASAGQTGKPLTRFQADLADLAASYGGPWQVFDALAEIRKEQGDYDGAFANYGIALNQVDDTVLTPDFMAPGADYILEMENAATEMRLASASALPMSSRATGCSFSTRGVEVPRKTVPIRFEFGKTSFTPNGLAAARELLTCLKLRNPEAITLIGHTDPVGSRQSNLDLSVRRAEAVADYLYRNGFTGTIATEGRGEDEPFAVDDPQAYDEQTLFQIYRRVQVDVR